MGPVNSGKCGNIANIKAPLLLRSPPTVALPLHLQGNEHSVKMKYQPNDVFEGAKCIRCQAMRSMVVLQGSGEGCTKNAACTFGCSGSMDKALPNPSPFQKPFPGANDGKGLQLQYHRGGEGGRKWTLGPFKDFELLGYTQTLTLHQSSRMACQLSVVQRDA